WLAYDEIGGEYSPDAFVAHVRVAGRWGAFVYATGEEAWDVCTKYQQTDCPPPVLRVRLVNVAARKRFDLPATEFPSRVAVSAAGAVAWLDGTTLRAARAGEAPRTLDTAKVD